MLKNHQAMVVKNSRNRSWGVVEGYRRGREQVQRGRKQDSRND